MKQQYIVPVDTCVVCGSVIPEGRQICPACEYAVLSSKHKFNSQPAIPAPDFFFRIKLLFNSKTTAATVPIIVDGTVAVFLQKQTKTYTFYDVLTTIDDNS